MASQFQLYIIRHAQSANNALPEPERVDDPAITDLGTKQVAQLAGRFGDIEITHALTSGFLRAIQTMRPVAEATGVQPEIWTDLHEVGGCFSGHVPGELRGMPGMTREILKEDFPEFRLPDDIDGEGWWKSKPFEDYSAAVARAETQATRLRSEFAGTDARVACVIHADFKDLLLAALLKADYEKYRSADLRNTGVTHLSLGEKATEVISFNDVSHLPGEWVTS